MKLIKNPWNNLFFDLVKGAKNSVKIAVPFLKKNVVVKLFEFKNNKSEFTLITSFKLMNYFTGVSDLEALQIIIDKKGTIKNFQKLHSKIYIFDDELAVISSGNLTNNGLYNNFEYGVLIEDKMSVSEIVSDYKSLYNNEVTGIISNVEIQKAKEILSKVPKSNAIKLPKEEFNNEVQNNELYIGGVESIISSLTGWTLEIFKCLLKIPYMTFNLNDVYNYTSYLKTRYPGNSNIHAKIRQQLQILRDIGILEFLGNGKYYKLFIQP